MLVSVASFLPIILVGPISDLIGTTAVILTVAIGVMAAGVASALRRDPHLGVEGATADPHAVDPIAAALGADRPTWSEDPQAPASRLASGRSTDEAAPATAAGPAEGGEAGEAGEAEPSAPGTDT
jgi:hypothetical protein